MQWIRWFFVSIPFLGLAWIIGEAMFRDRHALLEMTLDSEAFARAAGPLSAENNTRLVNPDHGRQLPEPPSSVDRVPWDRNGSAGADSQRALV